MFHVSVTPVGRRLQESCEDELSCSSCCEWYIRHRHEQVPGVYSEGLVDIVITMRSNICSFCAKLYPTRLFGCLGRSCPTESRYRSLFIFDRQRFARRIASAVINAACRTVDAQVSRPHSSILSTGKRLSPLVCSVGIVRRAWYTAYLYGLPNFLESLL